MSIILQMHLYTHPTPKSCNSQSVSKCIELPLYTGDAIWSLQFKVYVNPFPDEKNLDSFKLNEFADGNFRDDENG